jgi:uncharacterized repeat protein (TIGR01451 family)
MRMRDWRWTLILLSLLPCRAGAATADASCTFTVTPTGWQQRSLASYSLVMDRTWLFVPTGHIQIRPSGSTFTSGGKVFVTLNGGAHVPLYSDPDLHGPLGTEDSYGAGAGTRDEYFWADLPANAAATVEVVQTPTGGSATAVRWTVDVQCGGAGGLAVAPESPFASSGPQGGPFAPASQTYGLANSASSTLGYTVTVSSPGAGWLSLSSSSGSLVPGATGSVVAAVNASAANLAAGTYSATLTFRTSGSNPQTLTRTATLTVQPGSGSPPVLSGRITTDGGAPLEGVRMDGLPSVQWTDADGRYSVFVGSGWSGTARPSLAGYSFSPPSRTYPPVTAGLAGEDYTASATTFTVSGRVTLAGAVLPGVAMTGLPGSPVTDAAGQYAAVVPFHWSGTVTPQADGYVFTPASVTYTSVGMDFVDDYAAAQGTVTVSGRVAQGATGLGGALMSGLPGSVLTAADGTYTADVPYGWTGTVRPMASGYLFTPASLDLASVTAPTAGQDFAAAQAPRGTNRLWIVATAAELGGATASSVTGDMILVKPGTYVGASLNGLAPGTILVSEAGADQTILEVSFTANMNDVVIAGFTFRTSSSFEPVTVTGASNVRLRNCRFLAPSGAFGVRVVNSQNVVVETSVFSGYGGLLLRSGTSGGTLTLRNDQFVGNTQPFVGSGDPALQVIFENNLFRGSTYPAVALSSVASVLSRNNIFDSNYQGMSLSSIPGLVQLTQDTLVHNSVGYELYGSITASIFNTILQGNTRGIEANNATVSVHHLLHWQDTDWLYGSANYVLDETTIWQADPRFVNAAVADYHLASGSPARGVGQGGADLGAYGGALGTSWGTVPGTPQPAPALLDIEMAGPGRVDPGDTIRVTATGHFENGYYTYYQSGYYNSQGQWSSSDPTVLQSLGGGRFQALRPGQATVLVRAGSVTGSLAVTVLAPALRLDSAVTTSPALAGGLLTYQLTCTNDGPGVARNAQITAQYDARTAFVSAVPAPAAGSSSLWALGDLQAGAAVTVQITVRVSAGAAGSTLAFSAGATADFATAATAGEATAVLGAPDLQMGAGLAPSQVRPGGRLTATLTVRNAGSAPAQGVVVTATYPAGTAFRAATPPPGSGNGTWFTGTLAPGEQRVIAVDLDAAATAAGTLVLSAGAYGSDPDPTPADNQAAASAVVTPVADLAVAITDAPDPVLLGHPLVYSATVTNHGPSTAEGVTLTAQLPAALSLVAAVPDVGSCGGASPLTCQLGTLAPGAAVHVGITGIPGVAGPAQMTAVAASSAEDPSPADNTLTVTTDVRDGYDLYTVVPCRILDTRLTTAMASGVPRLVPVTGLCGIPATAKAVSLNVTAVAPTGAGYVSLWPADLAQPLASVVNFAAGTTRANNTILTLSTDGGGSLLALAAVGGAGTVHLVVDVNGYFQ